MSYFNATEKAEALRRIADRSADHEIVQTCKDAADELDEQAAWADSHFKGCKKLVGVLLPDAAWVSEDTVHEAAGEAKRLQARIAELEAEKAELQKQLDDEKAENDRLRGVVEKLPKTADGVTVVPNVDAIWIDPEAQGWMGEAPNIGSFDDQDDYVPEPVWQVTDWVLWCDHIAFTRDEWRGEGDHWQGPFYSTRQAAESAARGKGVG